MKHQHHFPWHRQSLPTLNLGFGGRPIFSGVAEIDLRQADYLVQLVFPDRRHFAMGEKFLLRKHVTFITR
jgi:hypothetical protein